VHEEHAAERSLLESNVSRVSGPFVSWQCHDANLRKLALCQRPAVVRGRIVQKQDFSERRVGRFGRAEGVREQGFAVVVDDAESDWRRLESCAPRTAGWIGGVGLRHLFRWVIE